MDTATAFIMGQLNRGRIQRVFDWDKALKILEEKKVGYAIAGLESDMEWTSGEILVDGELTNDSYTFLSSTWATPVIVLKESEDDDHYETIECWCYDTDEDNPHKYGSSSKWQDRHFEEWKKAKGGSDKEEKK